MKKKRFSLEQIVGGGLKQAKVGVPVVELIRKAGISERSRGPEFVVVDRLVLHCQNEFRTE